MTATTGPTPTRPTTAIRQVIARHPITTTLLLMFAVSWGLLIPPALAGITLEGPFLLAAVLFGQLLPAVLVTAAVGGRAAVRELFGRVFRWRVHPGWYLVALLAMPVAALLGSAVFGLGALRALVTDPSVIKAYLGLLVFLVPVISLWEETAWMGVIQARLAQSRGPLLAAVITGPLFGLVHLPLRLGGKTAGALLLSMLLAMVFAIPLRIVIGWLYNVTGASILLVAIFHATWDATTSTKLLTAAAPGQSLVTETPWALIVAWALLVVVLTRGQLGRRRDRQPVLED